MSEAEAVVRPILEAVRKRGDKGLLEYARKFDGLTRKSRPRAEAELISAADRLSPQFTAAVEDASTTFAATRRSSSQRIDRYLRNRSQARPDRQAARYGRRLHSGGPLSAAFHADHDGGPGTSGGRHKYLRGLPETGGRNLRGSSPSRGSIRSSRWVAHRP